MNFDTSPEFGKFLLIVFVLGFIGISPTIIISLYFFILFLKYIGIPRINSLVYYSLIIIMFPIVIVYRIIYRILDYKEPSQEHKDYCAKRDLCRNMPRLRKEVGKLSNFRRFVRKILRRGRIKRYHIIHNNIIELSVPNLTGLFAILVIGLVSISFIVFIIIRNI